MKYDDYYKLKTRINKELEKLYIEKNTIELCVQKTGSRTAKVAEAHMQEICNHLEEIVNLCDWFLGTE